MPERLLVVAAKSPQEGRVKTRLAAEGVSSSLCAALAAAFLTDTLAVAMNPAVRANVHLSLDGPAELLPPMARSLPVFSQTGNSLGERMVQILEQGFTAGYATVCIVGSDSPHLPPAFLIEAFGRLAAGAQTLFGPADDGGYYLVGVHSTSAYHRLFEEIPWSSPETLAVTLRRAEEAGQTVSLLPPWHDIDTLSDLRRLSRDLRRGVVHAPATAALLQTEEFRNVFQ